MIALKLYFIIFIIYSFLGWIAEVITILILNHKFINRGFLIGPYCPIYGCGAVISSILLTPLIEKPISIFIIGIVICSIIEYFTSYAMEKIFNARWWDYSQNKYNLNGRIKLGTSLSFGIEILAIIYIINPYLTSMLSHLSPITINLIFYFLIIIFVTDMIISFRITSNLKKIVFEASTDNSEEIVKKVKEILTSNHNFGKRLLKAFPVLTSFFKSLANKISNNKK